MMYASCAVRMPSSTWYGVAQGCKGKGEREGEGEGEGEA